jgi:hypothetical protein
MDKESVFITWDHNGINVKCLPSAFERIYVLNVLNLPKDLLHEDILMELHVYNNKAIST